MPRTRVRNQKTVKSKLENDDLQGAKKYLANYRKEIIDFIEMCRENMLGQTDSKSLGDRMMFVKKYNNMTLGELANLKSFSSLSSTCISGDNISNSTTTIKTTKKTVKRSSSCAGDDEGYLTTESTNSGPRASRSRANKSVQKMAQKRMTRSLSRTNTNKHRESSSNSTPLNKVTPSYGLITPKIKPNTPLVLVRRPKVGEVALSMQGSPLMTASVVMEKTANINIPLVDGTLLSLQAQRGLRKSQIPDLDPDVKRQLEMLRENLNLII